MTHTLADDIVQSVPWHCGFEDGCSQGWHLSNYWSHSDGTYTVDNYADGDHDPCDGVPDHAEVQKAWREYNADCVKTGADPLSQFGVTRSTTRRRLWQVRFNNSIIGAVFAGARRRGRGEWIRNAEDIPADVREYLALKRLNNVHWIYDSMNPPGGPSKYRELEELIESDESCRRQRSNHLMFMVDIDEITPRSEQAIRRDIRKSAQAAVDG
jgi:hypothetical protein